MNTADDHTKERDILELLEQSQQLLASSIKSFDGGKPNSFEEKYLWCMAVAVNQAAEGFASLRGDSFLAASKLMLRPAIEATICAKAAQATKEFYFRKVYSEWREDLKLFEKDLAKRKAEELRFDQFLARFKQEHPGYPAKKAELSLRVAAEYAGSDFVNIYEYPYRLYCQWTHNTMRSILGGLPSTDHFDSSIMCWCVLSILDSLKGHGPSVIPDLAEAKKRLEELSVGNSPLGLGVLEQGG
jgi:hypothetical protein